MQRFWHWFFVFSIAGILILSVIPPGSADEIYPTITDVFFEKDGLPWNESVGFTVNCYGYACKSWDCQRNPDDLLARNGNYSPQLYYSYHATVLTYGSRIYEPYYHAGRGYTSYCNLEGMTKNEQFIIRNFSQSPLPENCTDLVPFHRGSTDRYWNMTPEYHTCINATRIEQEECYNYVAICDPRTDRECRNWVYNGNNVKDTTASRACMDRVDKKRTACDRYLQSVDPESIVMWTDTDDGSEHPARRACELRIAIPPEKPVAIVSPTPEITIDPGQYEDGMTYGKPAVATARYASPVESLYCSIVEFLGGRCE